MNIFDVIPEKFFSLLASKNKVIYSKCIKLIFDRTKNEVSFSYSRSDVVEDIVEVLENEHLSDFDEIEDVKTHSYKDKANVILRKLKEYGWIIEGLNTDYTKTIFFPTYALPFIDAIDNIYENTQQVISFDNDDTYTEFNYSTKVEIEGYAYTIYSLLNNTSNLKKSTVLLQTTENIKLLLNSLKQLNYKIKSYSDSVKILTNIEDAIRDFFTEYTQEVLYKNYHKIKTLDNISKYRSKIITNLSSKLRNDLFIKTVSKELVSNDYFETVTIASEKVREMLHFCIDSLQNVDEIVKVIEEENYMYTNIILKKTKFMIKNYDDGEGYLKSILKKVVEDIKKEEEYELPEYFDKLFTLFSANYIDNESLYKPRKTRTVFKQSRIAVDEKINIVDINILDKLSSSGHSLKFIDKYVTELLGEKIEIKIEEIPLNTISDFIILIYMIIYASKSDKYSVDYFDDEIIVNGVKFRKFSVRGNS
ncbi:hypothetical protein KHQ82_05010 [Mycoplasmatota bacterium]|nr:hypothetical protein KHQ82_05010 [Mycoplasmatota bacterium]